MKPTGRKRRKVFVRDFLTCVYCCRPFPLVKNLTLDHIVPTKQGGSDSYFNLVTSCRKCNGRKSDRRLAAIQETALLAVVKDRTDSMLALNREWAEWRMANDALKPKPRSPKWQSGIAGMKIKRGRRDELILLLPSP